MTISDVGIHELRRRASIAAEQIAGLDRKIKRLETAKAERERALKKLRAEIALASPAGPLGSDRHDIR